MVGYHLFRARWTKRVLAAFSFFEDGGEILWMEIALSKLIFQRAKPLTYSASEFQRVGIATEKARVIAWVLNLGSENKWKPDERNSLGFHAKESVDNIYIKVLQKKELIDNSAEFENDLYNP